MPTPGARLSSSSRRLGGAASVLLPALLFGAAFLGRGSLGHAQPTSTTVLVTAEDEITQAQVTRVVAAFRDGVMARVGVRFVHPADALRHESGPDDVPSTVEKALSRLVTRAHEGAFDDVLSESTAALEDLAESPTSVSRTAYRDALLLQSIAYCGLGNLEACDDGFSEAVVGAETLAYDGERFPPAFAARYEATRRLLVEAGERGSMLVATEPAGAEVFVDGRSVGPSPALAEGLLAGQHHVAVRLAGFGVVQQLETVRTDREQRVEIALELSQSATTVRRKVPSLVKLAGPQVAPSPIAGLRDELGTDQVILASVRRADGRMRLSFSLYDLRTGFLLDHGQREFTDADISAAVSGLAQRSYADVPLDGVVAQTPVERPPAPIPVYRRWWFWAGVAVVAAAGGLTVGGALPRRSQVPSGVTRFDGVVR